MTQSILLISGGADFARDVYEREGRGDWAQAMPLVLEKLGYLGFAVSGPEALADPRTWERHAAVLVTRLPVGSWTPEAVELAGAGRARLLVELPPPRLHELAGIRAAGPASREGTVRAADPELAAAVGELSTRANARVAPPASRPVERVEEQAWPRRGVPIGAVQAERWREPGWDAEKWEVEAETDVLAEWIEDGDEPKRRRPALVRRGSVVACSFSLLGYLGQQTTVQPFAGAEHLISPRPFALEAMLAALLDAMHREAGVPRPRLLPWPEGATWALNVRHDFDRPRSLDEVDRVLAIHAEAGTAATWYWRSRHLDPPRALARLRRRRGEGSAVARRVASGDRHEVALHTERLWDSAEEELGAIEAAAGSRPRGSSAHGDPGCFRWQGVPNVLWAERHGLEYTEFISHAHLHPHRFAALAADGVIEPGRVICLPHHESLDRTTKPGDANTGNVLAAAEIYQRAGGLMQVLNHPDINLDELTETLGALPQEGRLDWTAAEAADWWRRTHVGAELSLEQARDGAVTLRSRRGVRGAVLELLDPDGSRRRYSLHLEAGGTVTVGGSSPPVVGAGGHEEGDPDHGGAGANGRLARWEGEVAPAFVRTARSYYERNGFDPDGPEAKSTLATNSTLVPGRVDGIRRYLAELGGVTSLRGARVLDCGAGFGAFAAYLSLDGDQPAVTAIEMRPEFSALAREVAAEAGLDSVTYEVGDMRSLDGLADGSFDVVVVNNAFIYLNSKQDMRRAVAELARVTAPGGHVCFFHANAWQAREPFTQAPLVHLLPAAVAGHVSRLTGWEHNHGRVRLISAPAMSRLLRRGGFTEVKVGVVRGGAVARAPRAYLGRFYAAVARRGE